VSDLPYPVEAGVDHGNFRFDLSDQQTEIEGRSRR
jgi:hypothetical protein